MQAMWILLLCSALCSKFSLGQPTEAPSIQPSVITHNPTPSVTSSFPTYFDDCTKFTSCKSCLFVNDTFNPCNWCESSETCASSYIVTSCSNEYTYSCPGEFSGAALAIFILSIIICIPICCICIIALSSPVWLPLLGLGACCYYATKKSPPIVVGSGVALSGTNPIYSNGQQAPPNFAYQQQQPMYSNQQPPMYSNQSQPPMYSNQTQPTVYSGQVVMAPPAYSSEGSQYSDISKQ